MDCFSAKMDKVGRIVIPKQIRQNYSIDNDALIGIKETDDGIILEKIAATTSVDRFGRTLIPRNIREKYNIKTNSTISLREIDKHIKIETNDNKYKTIIDKLKYIENEFNIDTILVDKSIKYISDNIKILQENRINTLEKSLSNLGYNYIKKELDKDNYYIYIVYKNNQKIIDLVYHLL